MLVVHVNSKIPDGTLNDIQWIPFVTNSLLLFYFIALAACSNETPTRLDQSSEEWSWELVNKFHHDSLAFTQGLLVYDGYIYESTGLYGHSSIRKVDIESGKIIQERTLPGNVFTERLARVENKFIQLTWLNYLGYVYDVDSLQEINKFHYDRQGWGITFDGFDLIMSDGSDTLFYWDAGSYEEKNALAVTSDGKPVQRLNELEFINGYIWANIWKSDSIAVIDPENGHVETWLDMSGILDSGERTDTADVLNGIAWDEEKQAIYITGKLWPHVFQIRVTGPENRL
ncbi:MAG: glutaminyl-peptide cyclotransferase [Calditrichaeota bacterium]|nr:MAG: glutaminyl-peptide cyclotransferase [Calditrichota bacterium]